MKRLTSEEGSPTREILGDWIAGKVTSILPLPSKFNRDWLWAIVLIGAVVVTYSPVGWASYLWDDDQYLTANPNMIGLHGLIQIWTTAAADISPLTLTTFWIEHALWGLEPLPYHLVNVLLHGACAVLLWQLLRRLNVPGPWLGAALWALHPVQVESVAWITETKNAQSGLFFLLSILCFLRWHNATSRSHILMDWLWFSLLSPWAASHRR